MRLNHLANSSILGRAVACLIVGVAMLSFAASPADASGITCITGYYSENSADPENPGDSYRCESIAQDFAAGLNSSQLFSFDGGLFTDTLSFDNLLHDMVITISAFFVDPMDSGNFLDRIVGSYVPEPFFTSDGPAWLYFRVEEPTPQQAQGSTGDFIDKWHQTLLWTGYGGYINPQMLHDPHSNGTNKFGDVITEFFDPLPVPPPPRCIDCCVECSLSLTDPAIGGGARDFSDVTTVDTVVPEPTSLLLLGSGMAGAWYRRRRQRALPARDSA